MAVNATAVWRARPSGSNTNGGGFDTGITGHATDYSQQDTAQASGTHGTTTGTTSFTDATANAFSALDIGNAIYITGTGQTTGWYFVTGPGAGGYPSSVALDRSPGTGTLATWHLGGGWADFWTNTTSSGPLVPGNQVLILGSGIPNPASYTYDYVNTSQFTPAVGNDTAGFITFANDPATPGYKVPPDTTGGMPCISFGAGTGQSLFVNIQYCALKGLWGVCPSGSGQNFAYGLAGSQNFALGCVADQFGSDDQMFGSSSGGVMSMDLIGCEVFSSVTPGASGASIAVGGDGTTGSCYILGCNIHDTVGNGVKMGPEGVMLGCIVAKCRGYGVALTNTSGVNYVTLVQNNTIDGNLGHGIEIATQQALATSTIMNNIISNHTQAGKFGMTIDVGTAAVNDAIKKVVDYNVFYNNTTDLNAISYGPHDTHGGSNPYVGQSTENYTLA